LVQSPERTQFFLRELAQWLQEQEQEGDWDVEAMLAFGGLGVAERMVGFEGLITSYTPPSTHDVLGAPAAAKKRIVVGLHVAIDGTGVFKVVKNKNTVLSLIVKVDNTDHDHEEVVGRHKAGYITLDATDESLEIVTVSGTADISFSGSYVDVD
jgi:hypothetical protein